MLFPTLKTKFGVKKKFPGGGGVWIFLCFFLENQFFLISRFMLFSTLKKNIEKCPFTYWLNGRWFLQIVERDSWNLYSDFVSQMWGWFGRGGGGVMFFSHFMLFPTFFVCWKYCIVPLHLQLLVKWEVVSPNSKYREFYHEIGNIEKFPFTYWLNGGGGFSKS